MLPYVVQDQSRQLRFPYPWRPWGNSFEFVPVYDHPEMYWRMVCLNLDSAPDHKVVYLNHEDADHCSSHHLYLLRLIGRTREDVNRVIELMAERGIATNVHYKPLPMMTAYKALGFDIKDFPNAYCMYENEITLPLNTKMTEEAE